MEHDSQAIILQRLDRIEAKVDEINKTNERLARIEAWQENQDKINTKVNELYSLKDRGLGVKGTIAWLATTGIAVAGFIINFLH